MTWHKFLYPEKMKFTSYMCFFLHHLSYQWTIIYLNFNQNILLQRFLLSLTISLHSIYVLRFSYKILWSIVVFQFSRYEARQYFHDTNPYTLFKNQETVFYCRIINIIQTEDSVINYILYYSTKVTHCL